MAPSIFSTPESATTVVGSSSGGSVLPTSTRTAHVFWGSRRRATFQARIRRLRLSMTAHPVEQLDDAHVDVPVMCPRPGFLVFARRYLQDTIDKLERGHALSRMSELTPASWAANQAR